MLKRPALIFQAGPKLIHLENKNGQQMDTITGVSCLPDVSPEKRHLSVLSVISIISQTVLRLANAPKHTIKNLININSNIFLLSYSKLAILLTIDYCCFFILGEASERKLLANFVWSKFDCFSYLIYYLIIIHNE